MVYTAPRSPIALALGGALVGLALIAMVTLATGSFSSSQSSAEPVELLASLQDEERADPTFASCVNQLKGAGMTLVNKVDQACGDVFTASQCSVECHAAATDLAATMGCCWRPLIAGFSKVQPSAAHAWHSWAFNLENLCGVSLPGECEVQTYSSQKSVADAALGAAQSVLLKAEAQQRAAAKAQEAAGKAQRQAQRLQREMRQEAKQFAKLRRHFRLSRADSARAVVVERMVHTSVKKDLQSAWGIHKQVQHDRKLAARMAAGTQIQQANAQRLLKSAHKAKKSVMVMAKQAKRAKRAAYRLHKLALQDLLASKRMRKMSKLQRAIARKAAADVKKQLKLSDAIIAKSKKEQGKAKDLWGALKDEEGAYDAEKKKAETGVAEEENDDHKMEEEIAAAEGKFGEFEKQEDEAEAAVANAVLLSQHAAKISEESEQLLAATQLQQNHIDKEREWINNQEGLMMGGRRGIAAMEGELEGLKSKYLSLRRAVSGLEYSMPSAPSAPTHLSHVMHRHVEVTPHSIDESEQHDLYADNASQYPSPQENEEEDDGSTQYVYAGMPLSRIVVPLPPHSQVDLHATRLHQQDDNEAPVAPPQLATI